MLMKDGREFINVLNSFLIFRKTSEEVNSLMAVTTCRPKENKVIIILGFRMLIDCCDDVLEVSSLSHTLLYVISLLLREMYICKLLDRFYLKFLADLISLKIRARRKIRMTLATGPLKFKIQNKKMGFKSQKSNPTDVYYMSSF